jgi:hypothetical protein
MSDDEFLAALEGRRLPAAEFDHAAHLRLGYLYLRRASFADAAARACRTIRLYAASLGSPGRYHETLTIGFMALIAERLRRGGDGGGWAGFMACNPGLLSKNALLAYYPRAVLESAEARAAFVLPTARPLG